MALRHPALLTLALLAACGGAQRTASTPAAPPAAASRKEAAQKPAGGMQVAGLMGTIPQRRIEETMHAQLPAFQRCFFEGMNEVELLGGHMKFYFRVGLDGRVEWVHPRGSSIGHRATELCLLQLAQQTHFPPPRGGGPAEFVWGFELENPGGLRPPVAWPETRVGKLLTAHRAALEQCAGRDAHYVVTAYVAPGGKVLAAGAAADSQPAAEKIDCVIDEIKRWRMPDPGSYPAKVSFSL
jgi:hypothetical protein